MTTHPKVLVCFGDSNTYGSAPMNHLEDIRRHGPDQRWPGVLAEHLGADWHVVEEALPGTDHRSCRPHRGRPPFRDRGGTDHHRQPFTDRHGGDDVGGQRLQNQIRGHTARHRRLRRGAGRRSSGPGRIDPAGRSPTFSWSPHRRSSRPAAWPECTSVDARNPKHWPDPAGIRGQVGHRFPRRRASTSSPANSTASISTSTSTASWPARSGDDSNHGRPDGLTATTVDGTAPHNRLEERSDDRRRQTRRRGDRRRIRYRPRDRATAGRRRLPGDAGRAAGVGATGNGGPDRGRRRHPGHDLRCDLTGRGDRDGRRHGRRVRADRCRGEQRRDLPDRARFSR